MFLDVVFILLALLLFTATIAALYLGLFRAGRPGLGPGRKALYGLLSALLAGAFWGLLYSHHYLGW